MTCALALQGAYVLPFCAALEHENLWPPGPQTTAWRLAVLTSDGHEGVSFCVAPQSCVLTSRQPLESPQSRPVAAASHSSARGPSLRHRMRMRMRRQTTSLVTTPARMTMQRWRRCESACSRVWQHVVSVMVAMPVMGTGR